jgi:predicted metalloprotease with PDZ domain
VALEKLSKSSWKAPAGIKKLEIFCEVYAWDLSVRSAHLDNFHGFYNGTSVFLSVDGQLDSAIEVDIVAPEGAAFSSWNVATSLPAKSIDVRGFGSYKAADYDELIDHPVEMGTFERVAFSACGVPHELVLTGHYHTDTARIAADLKRICETEIHFFGEPAPVERYVFLVMVVGEGYGGLEHRASTALLVSRDTLPVPGDETLSDGYIQFLGLCSHEYFHTWNVKRIKPLVFQPYELAAESYTRLLWFFEGMTSYYDDLLLLRSGLINTDQYLELLGKTISRVHRGGGRLKQSVTDSSFDAWNKFYKQDENAPNAIVSYYAKGALVALCLDAKIRAITGNQQSLDCLMRRIWEHWLSTKTGLTETQPEVLASELCNTDLTKFFNSVLYSTDELPLDEAFQSLGLKSQWQQRKSLSDSGGKSNDSKTTYIWIGATLAAANGGVKLAQVFNGEAAELAGLAPGDVLIAIQNTSINLTNFDGVLQRYKDLEKVQVHYFRHQELCLTELPIVSGNADSCSLEIAVPDVTKNWLYSMTA